MDSNHLPVASRGVQGIGDRIDRNALQFVEDLIDRHLILVGPQ